MKEIALKQHDRSIRNDFFLHFLDGTLSSQEEIIGRAAEFSLQNQQMYICAVGKIDGELQQPTYIQQHEDTDELFDFIESDLAEKTPHIHFFKKGEMYFIIRSQENIPTPSEFVEANLLQVQERVAKFFGKPSPLE